MRFWQLIALGLIFISLTLLYFLKQRPMSQEMAKVFITLLPEIKERRPDYICAFSRSNSDEKLELRKTKDGWEVHIRQEEQDFWAPAKGKKVEKLIKDLSDFTGELRSSSQKYLGDFGLAQGQGLEIVLKRGGREITRIVVGKKGPSWGTSFVKRHDSNRVFLVSRDLLGDFDIWANEIKGPIEVRPWIDLVVIPNTSIDVEECRFESKSVNWSLSRQTGDKKDGKGKWAFTLKGKKQLISQEDASKILNQFFPLYAKDVLPKGEVKALDKRTRFVYKIRNGKEHSLFIYGFQKKEGYCILKDDRGYVFKVDRSILSRLKSPDSILKKRIKKG